jgi:hypothetical protein
LDSFEGAGLVNSPADGSIHQSDDADVRPEPGDNEHPSRVFDPVAPPHRRLKLIGVGSNLLDSHEIWFHCLCSPDRLDVVFLRASSLAQPSRSVAM